VILDTNAYSALARAVRSIVDQISGAAELKLPLPVIAELRYGFVKGSQTGRNEQVLQKFLSQPQVSIIMPSMKTTAIYAELQLRCVKHGKALSQNDIWIAALAKETEDLLLTFDRDFEVFLEIFGGKLIILSE
jgi:predicted nucleic acid-binding protein